MTFDLPTHRIPDVSPNNQPLVENAGNILNFCELPDPAREAILKDDSFMQRIMGDHFVDKRTDPNTDRRTALNLEQLSKMYFWYGCISMEDLWPRAKPYYDAHFTEQDRQKSVNRPRPVALWPVVLCTADNDLLLDGYHRLLWYKRYSVTSVPAMARTKIHSPAGPVTQGPGE